MCYGNNTLITGKIIMSKKHYLVYKTTNLVNGKIYIGKHETDNLDDGYLGSGILIRRAIEKYGEENFKREILFECSSREEMNAKEAELVNEDFLKRDDVYNLKQGGQGGFDFIIENGLNTNPQNNSIGGKAFAKRIKEDEQFRAQLRVHWASNVKRARHEHPEKFRQDGANNGFFGKHHSQKSIEKIRAKAHLRIGEQNGSFGTVWIYNESLKQNKKVKKEQADDFFKQGWKLGRRMNFHK